MHKTKASLFFLPFLLFYVLAPAEAVDSVQDTAIVVIVHKSNPIHDITVQELARIYKGKATKWSDGNKISVVNRESAAPIRSIFYKNILGAKVGDAFSDTGTGLPFQTNIQTSAALVRYVVSHLPGAVGYVYSSETDETVKVLKIEGLRPDQEGYKLSEHEQNISQKAGRRARKEGTK